MMNLVRAAQALGLALAFFSTFTHASAAPQFTSDSPYDPRWALVPPTTSRFLHYDAQGSPEGNGLRLIARANALLPGEELVVDSATWVLPPGARISVQGVYGAPIMIRAAVDRTA